MAALPTQSPSDLPLDTYAFELTYAGTTAPAGANTHYPPSNAQRVTIGCSQTSGTAPVNQGIWVVFNAVNNTDATNKLTNGGLGRFFVPMGRTRTFNFDAASPCARIDWQGHSTANETAGFLVFGDVGIKA